MLQVQSRLSSVASLVDPRMGGCEEEAAGKLLSLAMACLSKASAERPAMDEVSRRLSEVKNMVEGVEDKGISVVENPGSFSEASEIHNLVDSSDNSSHILVPVSSTFGFRS